MTLDDWDNLPIAQRQAHTAASNGLLDGDLAPLAAYIREGWPIDALLAEQIANAINGPDEEGFGLRMINKRGHRKFSERDEQHRETIDLALYVHARQVQDELAGLTGTYESIIAEARERFKVGRSTVTDAVREARKVLGEEVWLNKKVRR